MYRDLPVQRLLIQSHERPELRIQLFSPGDQAPRPVVIILHRFAGSRDSEMALIDRLLARGYGAVSFDGLGHGDRRREIDVPAFHNPSESRAYRFLRIVEALIDDGLLVARHLAHGDIEQAAGIGLVGISMGGTAANAIALCKSPLAAIVSVMGAGDLIADITKLRNRRDQQELMAGWRVETRSLATRLDPMQHLSTGHTVPLLLLNAVSDPIVDIGAVRKWYRAAKTRYAASGKEIGLLELKGVRHEVNSAILRECELWLERYLPTDLKRP